MFSGPFYKLVIDTPGTIPEFEIKHSLEQGLNETQSHSFTSISSKVKVLLAADDDGMLDVSLVLIVL